MPHTSYYVVLSFLLLVDMEALAEYGSSDSSSSSEADRPAEGGGGSAGTSAGNEAKPAPSLAALLPQASSSSSEDDEDEGKQPSDAAKDSKPEPVEKKEGLNGGISPSRKRRRWDNPGGNASETRPATASTTTVSCPLPPPPLSSSAAAASRSTTDEQQNPANPFEELIRYERDYTVQLRANIAAAATRDTSDDDADMIALQKKLDDMYKSFYSDDAVAANTTDVESGRPTTFASHLRTQHEFGNPNLFPSVLEHCAIDPRGSNLPKDLWDPNEFKDFEMVDRLMAAEEHARINAAAAAASARQSG